MATWTCPGGAKPYSEDDPKAIVRHVSGCDCVDGAGQPADLHVKFSVVHYYLAAVRSDTLAGVTGRDAARIAKAIDNSTVSEAIADAVWQVCGYPAEPDEPR